MKTVMVFGAGRMGLPTAIFLKTLGYNVVLADQMLNKRVLYNADLYNIGTLEVKKDYDYAISLIAPHLVVSCLPYFENVTLFRAAARAGCDYFDLGGKVDNTEIINGEFRNIATFTDLGLAPGLINIFAEYELKQFTSDDIDSVKCFVGGIPVDNVDPPFNYYTTWSMEGLINEYRDNAVVIRNGGQHSVPGMSEVELVDSHVLNKKLEAFITSGATSHSLVHMQAKKIKNFEYKTLRYPGHINFVKNLSLNYGWDFATSVIDRLSQTAPVTDDVVICKLHALQGNKLVVDKELCIRHSEDMTAMQRATAGPLAVITHMRLEGYLPTTRLSYGHVVNHFAYMKCKLKDLGIDLNET